MLLAGACRCKKTNSESAASFAFQSPRRPGPILPHPHLRVQRLPASGPVLGNCLLRLSSCTELSLGSFANSRSPGLVAGCRSMLPIFAARPPRAASSLRRADKSHTHLRSPPVALTAVSDICCFGLTKSEVRWTAAAQACRMQAGRLNHTMTNEHATRTYTVHTTAFILSSWPSSRWIFGPARSDRFRLVSSSQLVCVVTGQFLRLGSPRKMRLIGSLPHPSKRVSAFSGQRVEYEYVLVHTGVRQSDRLLVEPARRMCSLCVGKTLA